MLLHMMEGGVPPPDGRAMKYAEALLEREIAILEAELAAWEPPQWKVDPLKKAYVDGQALEAVIGVFDKEIEKAYAARQQALADHLYGQRKLQHLYL